MQEPNGWVVSGSILVENANKILLKSNTLNIENKTHEVNFSKVTEVDTSAISLMLEWQRRAAASNSKVTFSHLPTNLTSLMMLYGVTEFIPLS
ncbi:MAG: STAS domain-containing protein [Methylophilaceae bacterium]